MFLSLGAIDRWLIVYYEQGEYKPSHSQPIESLSGVYLGNVTAAAFVLGQVNIKMPSLILCRNHINN